MKKIAILCLIKIWFFVIVTSVVAAPSISSVQGSISDNNKLTVQGIGFGEKQLDIEWLGGSDGYIETATSGASFSKSGWYNYKFSNDAKIDRSQFYSGNQSIVFDSTTANDGRFNLTYNCGSDFRSAYVTWMARIDTGGAKGQWKMFRMNWEQNVEDTAPEIVMFNWFGGGGNMFIVRRVPGELEQRSYLADSDFPQSGEWVRMELILKPSSSPGVHDGSVDFYIHRPNVSIKHAYSRADLETYLSGESRRWRYFVFQNYQGNGLSGHSKVWMDDIYIQKSRARVEIGNAPNWENCTHREIQIPSTWTDKSISFTVNQGSFHADETAYFFVIDETGAASQGVEFVFGETGSTPPPPPEDPDTLLQINSPSSNGNYLTTENTISLGGSASNDVTSMTWQNSRGGSGNIPASTNWNVNDISLLSGENVITVTATGNQGKSAQITVNYNDNIMGWSANEQAGDATWSNSSVTYCVRLLIESDHITKSGNEVRLVFQGRSTGTYSIRKVSIAERDNNSGEGDVIDSTWKRVTFDGNSETTWGSDVINIPAGDETVSDPIAFNMQTGRDYYVTFKIETPSVYLDPPSSYRELYFSSADHSSDIDWSGNGHATTQDFHAFSKIYVSGTASTALGVPVLSIEQN